MAKILFAPPNWMAVNVLDRATENNLLRQGYRRENPNDKPTMTSSSEPVQEQEETESELINVNTAELKELTELRDVGVVTARKIINGRDEEPFEVIEDLIGRIPGVDWLSLSNQITF